MNRCHVCNAPAINADAALCLTCSERANRGEVWYDPHWGWMQTLTSNIEMHLAAQCAAPEGALPNGSNIEVSTVREGFRQRSTINRS